MKKADVLTEDLIKLYKCFLVSIIDYASVVYHPLLTADQSKRLENLQITALRIILRYNMSYAKLLEKGGLNCLSERRIKLVYKFIIKAVNNPRFRDSWFTMKHFHHHDPREEIYFEEKFAHTNMLFNSPLYFYR